VTKRELQEGEQAFLQHDRTHAPSAVLVRLHRRKQLRMFYGVLLHPRRTDAWYGEVVGVKADVSHFTPFHRVGLNSDIGSMASVQQLLEYELPGVYVHRVEIGNGGEDSLWWPIGYQVSEKGEIRRLPMLPFVRFRFNSFVPRLRRRSLSSLTGST
jgi:hypothetical protein